MKRNLLVAVTAVLLAPPAIASTVHAVAELALPVASQTDQRAWRGDPVAELRRQNLVRLLQRDAGLGGAAALPADADDAHLAQAFAAYVRRLGGERTLARAQLDAALALLGQAPHPGPLGLPLLELRLVAALGGWAPVETAASEPEPPAISLSPAELMVVAFVHGEEQTAGLLGVPRRLALSGSPRIDASTLRQRLRQSGDLRDGDDLTAGLKRFQARHGLSPDAIIGQRTLAALSQPVGWQIRQVELNLAREAHLAGRAGLSRYVEVNLPAYELRLVENGEVTLRSRVIVGAESSPTPIFDDQIRYIELNPAWYVPASIVEELLLEAGDDPTYFERNNFIVRGGGESGEPLRLTQRPGPWNALGRMKFLFPNHHAVYLHDTAQRGLFGRSEQSLSHGCIRVERPMELAMALLAEEGWDQERIEASLDKGRTRRIELTEPVPVLLDYRTAFVDETGALQLRTDIYGHDAAGTGAFADKRRGSPPALLPVKPPLPRAAETVASSD